MVWSEPLALYNLFTYLLQEYVNGLYLINSNYPLPLVLTFNIRISNVYPVSNIIYTVYYMTL